MKKVSLLMLFTIFCTAFSAQSQQIGNYTRDEILIHATDPTDKFYFPKLIESFQSNASLDTDALIMLYYGFSTQDGYQPYENWLLEKQLLEAETGKEPEKTIALADSLLKINPVSLLAYNKLYWANRSDKKSLAMQYKAKYETLAKAINATGAGKQIETAPVLISIGDKFAYAQFAGRTLKPKEEYLEQDNQQYNLAYYANPASPVISLKWYFNTTIPYQKDSRLQSLVEEWASNKLSKKK